MIAIWTTRLPRRKVVKPWEMDSDDEEDKPKDESGPMRIWLGKSTMITRNGFCGWMWRVRRLGLAIEESDGRLHSPFAPLRLLPAQT